MGFTKKDNIYKITRMTGNHDVFWAFLLQKTVSRIQR